MACKAFRSSRPKSQTLLFFNVCFFLASLSWVLELRWFSLLFLCVCVFFCFMAAFGSIVSELKLLKTSMVEVVLGVVIRGMRLDDTKVDCVCAFCVNVSVSDSAFFLQRASTHAGAGRTIARIAMVGQCPVHCLPTPTPLPSLVRAMLFDAREAPRS